MVKKLQTCGNMVSKLSHKKGFACFWWSCQNIDAAVEKIVD